MDNYLTSTLTASELSMQVLNDPKATDRERDLAERLAKLLNSPCVPTARNLGRGDRGGARYNW